MHTLLLWAQSILSFTIFLPQTSFHSEDHLLSLCMCNTPPAAPISSAGVMHLRPALPSLLLMVMLGWKEWGKGPPGFFIIRLTCFYNLHRCLQTLTESPFYPQNKNKTLLSKTKGALSTGEHGMQTYEPQDWTTLLGQPNFFTHWQYNLNAIPGTPNPSIPSCCLLLSRDLLLQACKLSWPRH